MLINQQLFQLCLAVLLLVLGAIFGGTVAAGDNVAADRWDFERHVIARIRPGTVVGKDNPGGWNRTLLLATPRLGAGAVNKVPKMAQNYATRFKVVIMARVRAIKKPADETTNATLEYRLEQIGVGYCVEIGGTDVVISSATQQKLGADLDTIEQIVLKQNEKVLNDIVQIVASKTFAVFDVQALMLDNGKHRDILLRHMVWVVPKTGKVASLVWPMLDASQGDYSFAGKSLFALPGGFREDRIIHVSADEITFGIPSARAFALARMPAGKRIPVTAEIVQLAAKRNYTRTSMAELVNAVREAF